MDSPCFLLPQKINKAPLSNLKGQIRQRVRGTISPVTGCSIFRVSLQVISGEIQLTTKLNSMIRLLMQSHFMFRSGYEIYVYLGGYTRF